MPKYSYRVLNIILFVLVFTTGSLVAQSVRAGEFPDVDKQYREATARAEGDQLTVSTGQIERTWQISDTGLVTVSVKDLERGVEWITPDAAVASDWHLPAVTEGPVKVVNVEAGQHKDEGFTHNHLKTVVTLAYPQAKTRMQLVVWAYPGAAGLRTQLRFKAMKGFDPSGTPTFKNLPKFFRSSSARIAQFATGNPSANQSGHVRTVKYSKFNTPRANQINQHPMMREQKVSLPASERRTFILQTLASVERSSGRLAVIKESPVTDTPVRDSESDWADQPSAYVYRPGGFVIQPAGRLEVTGAGIAASDLIQNRYRSGWANWTVVTGPENTDMQRAIKQFDRVRFPFNWEKDWYVGFNNWGSTSNPKAGKKASREPSILKEIRAANQVGGDLVQIDDGWQRGKSSKLNPKAYPDGWTNVRSLANEKELRLGLWMGWVQEVSIDRLIKHLNEGGLSALKVDFYNTSTWSKAARMRRIGRRIHKEVEHPITINWDVTGVQSKNTGFFYNREYGILWLKNQKQHNPEHVLYKPWTMLRDAWEVSHYVNLDQVQLAIQNPDADYPAGTDAPKHSQRYCTAIALMGAPNYFQELKELSQKARKRIHGLLNVYKQARPEMAKGHVYPIGARPDNSTWTGFQNYNGDTDASYLLVFRERMNPVPGTRIGLRFYGPNTEVKVTNLLTQESRTTTLDDQGRLGVEIPDAPGFRFLKCVPAKR